MTTHKTSRLKIASNPSEIIQVESYVQSVAKQFNISPDIYPNILISLTEAVNNAIIHGNNKDKSKFVKISLEEDCDLLVEDIADPTAEENIGCCGGRGVHIMKELSDEIDFLDNGRRVKICFKHRCVG